MSTESERGIRGWFCVLGGRPFLRDDVMWSRPHWAFEPGPPFVGTVGSLGSENSHVIPQAPTGLPWQHSSLPPVARHPERTAITSSGSIHPSQPISDLSARNHSRKRQQWSKFQQYLSSNRFYPSLPQFPSASVITWMKTFQYLSSCRSVWWVVMVNVLVSGLYLMLFILYSLVIAGLFERPCLQSLEIQRSSEWTETHYQSRSERKRLCLFWLIVCLQ